MGLMEKGKEYTCYICGTISGSGFREYGTGIFTCKNCRVCEQVRECRSREAAERTPPIEAMKKFDNGKDNLALLSNLPLKELLEVSKVIEFGAKKYGRNNWKRGTSWLRVSSALLRHIFAFLAGENNDNETGISHLAHAMCNLLFLLYYVNNTVGEDDRLCNRGVKIDD